ncbi:MAG: putative DNA-binding domain-containing protein [Bacteriovoracia bacterium]
MEFDSLLAGGNPPMPDIIGAGNASAEKAIAHYRFQYQAKVREAIEDTFPVLKDTFKKDWELLWSDFWAQYQNSPRSLDFVSEKFLHFFQNQDAPLHLKELAEFEYALDIYPWSNREAPLVSLDAFTAETKLTLIPLYIRTFKASVIALYEGEDVSDFSLEEKVLIWLKDDTVHYRALEDWEINVLAKIPEGIEEALRDAPEDSLKIQNFFQWLASSRLILSKR